MSPMHALILTSMLTAGLAVAATPPKAPVRRAQVAAAARATTSTALDVAEVIAEAARRAPTMKVGAPIAAQRLDRMLATDYRARGSIATERDRRLKGLYAQAATLILNGYPIAGGTLVVIARQEPAFTRSPVGPAYMQFVNAMLAPTGEQDDLSALSRRAAAARAALAPVRPELRMGADLAVMGALYEDTVAQQAGNVALQRQGATKAERAAIAAALRAAGVTP